MSSKNLNNFCQKIADSIYHLVCPVSRFEEKLLRSQRYRPKTVKRWSRQRGLSWATTNKILQNLEILDSHKIRDLIRDAVQKNPDIFLDEHCYITRFGEPGKSGDVIFYEFCHATGESNFKLIDEPWKVAGLPSKSRIVFVDDLIGTGSQSVEYINRKLSSLFASSHRPCLFSVCATPTGIETVKQHSTFEVICAMELEEVVFNHYNEHNTAFTRTERESLHDLNERLGQNFFVMGLLVAFYYSSPDNTMPLIWRDRIQYKDADGRENSWFALLPRKS